MVFRSGKGAASVGMIWSITWWTRAWILNSSDHVLYWPFSILKVILMKFVMFEMVKAGWVGGDVVAEAVDWEWGDKFLVGEGVDETLDMMRCWWVIRFFFFRRELGRERPAWVFGRKRTPAAVGKEIRVLGSIPDAYWYHVRIIGLVFPFLLVFIYTIKV
jgi:hypothetical protein